MSFRVVEILLEVPTNTYARLRSTLMPMYGHHRPRLQRIQHTLTLIIRRIPQIHGHAEPRTLFRLRRQLVKYLRINNHIILPALPREMGTCPSGNEPTQRRAFCYFTTKTIYLNTRALLSMFVLSNTLPYSTPSASSPARSNLRHTRPIRAFPSGNKNPRRKLIRIKHRIIILHRNFLHGPIVPRRLPRRHVLQDHLIFQPILKRRRPRNAGPKFQHVPVLPHKLIRIPRHIRPRTDETHLADERLPQACRCHSIVFWRSIALSRNPSIHR